MAATRSISSPIHIHSDSEDDAPRPSPQKKVKMTSSALGFAVTKVGKKSLPIKKGSHIQEDPNTSAISECVAGASSVQPDRDHLSQGVAGESGEIDTPAENTEGADGRLTPEATCPPAQERASPPAKTVLYNTPVIGDRYIPVHSFEEGVDFRNAQKFCVKPGYWRKWTPDEYINLIEHIRFQFDPVPFARANDKPVEEVVHMFNCVVANPLYCAEKAVKRGEYGMQKLFELFSQQGTISRPWMDGKVKGELEKVGKGVVKIIFEDGSNKDVKIEELGKQDLKYLKETLLESDWKLFSGFKEEGNEDA